MLCGSFHSSKARSQGFWHEIVTRDKAAHLKIAACSGCVAKLHRKDIIADQADDARSQVQNGR
jgi:hypothetical protein